MVTAEAGDDGDAYLPVTAAEMVELCASYAPRRFAACEISPDGTAVDVLGLGIHTDEGGVMLMPDESSVWRLHSPERVARLLGRRRDVRLVWLDPVDGAVNPPEEVSGANLPGAR
jgi:hypothetical protein